MRLTQHLVKVDTFAASPVCVVDVGARDGFAPEWDLLGSQATLIGFEPEPDEYQRLVSLYQGTNKSFLPYALYREAGRFPLYVTAVPDSTSMYKPNMRLLDRLPDGPKYQVKQTIMVKVTTLDALVRDATCPAPDFLNIDVQGADLDVMKGAEATLRESVLALVTEVEFNPLYDGQSLFADVDHYLRGLDFHLFDLTISRHARKVMSPRMFATYPGRTPSGQVIWGEAIYLRDPIASEGEWDRQQLLKLACYMELRGLQDCAVELLLWGKDKGVLGDVDEYLDFLAPRGSYQGYLTWLRQQPERRARASPARRLLGRTKRAAWVLLGKE